MNFKRGTINLPVIILLVFGVFTIGLVSSFLYFSVNGPDHSNAYSERISLGEIKNPLTMFNLINDNSEDIEQTGGEIIKIDTEDGEKTIIIKNSNIDALTIKEIEEELLNYVSIILKLYNLHPIPFTSITPKIQVHIGNNSYFIEILKGEMIVERGVNENPDIIFRTTTEKMFEIIEDESSIKESFNNQEKFEIELVANYFTLFSKGYWSLYQEMKEEL